MKKTDIRDQFPKGDARHAHQRCHRTSSRTLLWPHRYRDESGEIDEHRMD